VIEVLKVREQGQEILASQEDGMQQGCRTGTLVRKEGRRGKGN